MIHSGRDGLEVHDGPHRLLCGRQMATVQEEVVEVRDEVLHYLPTAAPHQRRVHVHGGILAGGP